SAIARRPLPVVAITLLLAVPCAWAYASVRVDTVLLETFDPSDPIAISTHLVEDELDGILPLELHVHARGASDVRDPAVLAALDRIAVAARAQGGVLRASSPSDLLWETWRRIAGIAGDAPHTPFRSRAQVDALSTLIDRLQPSPARDWLTP